VAAKVKVVHEGETVEADQLDFKAESATSGVYAIEDGSRIAIQHEVKAVYRLEKKKADGTPIYLITGGAAVQVTQPKDSPGKPPVVQPEQQIKA
jgi:hypothetical protein